MEYHWYEDYWAMPRNLPRGHEFFIGYYQTQRAIHHHVLYTTSETCYAVSKVVRANADSIIEELVMKGYSDLTQFESEQDE